MGEEDAVRVGSWDLLGDKGTSFFNVEEDNHSHIDSHDNRRDQVEGAQIWLYLPVHVRCKYADTYSIFQRSR